MKVKINKRLKNKIENIYEILKEKKYLNSKILSEILKEEISLCTLYLLLTAKVLKNRGVIMKRVDDKLTLFLNEEEFKKCMFKNNLKKMKEVSIEKIKIEDIRYCIRKMKNVINSINFILKT
jgi:predicted metal-dependent hydrolase